MNVKILHHEDHSEVRVEDLSRNILHVFTFNLPDEAKAFWQGFKCCQSVVNSLVQSLPMNYKEEHVED